MITRSRIQTIAVGAACFAVASLAVQANTTTKTTPSLVGIADGADSSVIAHVNASGQLQVGGTVTVANMPAQQTVTGTVNVANLPATQQVSIANLPTIQTVNVAAPEQLNLWTDISVQAGGSSGESFLWPPGLTTTYSVPTGKRLAVDMIGMTCYSTASPPLLGMLQVWYPTGSHSFPIVLTATGAGSYAAAVQWPLVLPAGTTVKARVESNQVITGTSCGVELVGHLVDVEAQVVTP